MTKVVVDELYAVLYVKGNRVFGPTCYFLTFVSAQDRSKFSVPQVSSSRIVDVLCNEPAHYVRLSRACFRIMKPDLRFNICDLSWNPREYWSSPPYSCRYCVQHLNRAASCNRVSLRSRIDEFIFVRVPNWIEAMNLLGSRAQCSLVLQNAHEWVLKVRDPTRPRGLELMPVQANDQKYSDLAPHLSEAANSARTLVESQRRSPHHTFFIIFFYYYQLLCWEGYALMVHITRVQVDKREARGRRSDKSTPARPSKYLRRGLYKSHEIPCRCQRVAENKRPVGVSAHRFWFALPC